MEKREVSLTNTNQNNADRQLAHLHKNILAFTKVCHSTISDQQYNRVVCVTLSSLRFICNVLQNLSEAGWLAKIYYLQAIKNFYGQSKINIQYLPFSNVFL